MAMLIAGLALSVPVHAAKHMGTMDGQKGMGSPQMMDADMQKKMDQMRKQMDEMMKGASAPGICVDASAGIPAEEQR